MLIVFIWHESRMNMICQGNRDKLTMTNLVCILMISKWWNRIQSSFIRCRDGVRFTRKWIWIQGRCIGDSLETVFIFVRHWCFTSLIKVTGCRNIEKIRYNSGKEFNIQILTTSDVWVEIHFNQFCCSSCLWQATFGFRWDALCCCCDAQSKLDRLYCWTVLFIDLYVFWPVSYTHLRAHETDS